MIKFPEYDVGASKYVGLFTICTILLIYIYINVEQWLVWVINCTRYKVHISKYTDFIIDGESLTFTLQAQIMLCLPETYVVHSNN